MSLRSKIVLAFSLTIFILGLCIVLYVGYVLLYNIDQNEKNFAHIEIRRAVNSFQRELSDLTRATRDYAGWDDTYQYIIDRNQEYIDSNFSDATFFQNRLNSILIINLAGEIVYQKSFNLQEKVEIPTSPALIDFARTPALREKALQSESVGGFWLLGNETHVIVACPILTSQFEGPARGILIFSRILNSGLLDYLSQIIEKDVSLALLDSKVIPPDVQKKLLETTEEGSLGFYSVSPNDLEGFGLLQDGFSQPAFAIQISIPRVYHLQSVRMIAFLLGFEILGVLGIAAITWILLERLFLKRLADLHQFVQSIEPSRNMQTRFQRQGNDELTQLGEKINGLLDRLAIHYDEQRRVEIELRESERKYRTIVENINDALVIHDFHGAIFDVNDQACHLLGHSREELLAKNLFQVDAAYHGDLFSKIVQLLNSSNTAIYNSEYYLSEGNLLYFETSSKVVSREGNGIIQSFVRDITERKLFEENLPQVQKMEAIGQLASGIAHDFNNLLTGILGYADIMHRKAETGSLIANAAQVIKKTATRASELTRQLLGFVRSDKITMCPVDVKSIIEEIILLLERTIERNITFQVHFASNSLLVLGDSGQIQQALLNLAINARDAMPDGGIIKFSASRIYIDDLYLDLQVNSYVVVSVEDTGCGIAEEIKDRIFEPFFTTKEVGKGTGMGLAMVYGIVKNHRGTIQVTSEVGRGTTFTLYLPQYQSKEKILEKRSSDYGKSSGLVMLIDDDENVLKCTTDMLQEIGYQVVPFSSGKKGVEYYCEHQKNIDFVILDMIMPEMNGQDCFRKLREINPAVRVFLSSGFTLNLQIQEFLEMGFYGYINKPFTLSELSEALTEVRKLKIE